MKQETRNPSIALSCWNGGEREGERESVHLGRAQDFPWVPENHAFPGLRLLKTID